jgi:hypothetical protein
MAHFVSLTMSAVGGSGRAASMEVVWSGHDEAFARLAYRPLVTDRAMEAWYRPSIAWMTSKRRVTWQATSDDENS